MSFYGTGLNNGLCDFTIDGVMEKLLTWCQGITGEPQESPRSVQLIIASISSYQRIKLFKPVLPALVPISEAFPPSTDEIVQLAKICDSQASHFDTHMGQDNTLRKCKQENQNL